MHVYVYMMWKASDVQVFLPATLKIKFVVQHHPVDTFDHCSLFSF